MKRSVILASGELTSGTLTILTVPADRIYEVTFVHLCNYTASNASVTMTGQALWFGGYVLSPHGVYTWYPRDLVMEEGQTVTASGTSSAVQYVIYGKSHELGTIYGV